MFVTMLKSFMHTLIYLVAPYLVRGLLQVVIPLLVESLNAVIAGGAAIGAAKQKVKDSWKTYVQQAKTDAFGTASLIDDWLFSYLAGTELDDIFVEKLFDQAVLIEQKFFALVRELLLNEFPVIKIQGPPSADLQALFQELKPRGNGHQVHLSRAGLHGGTTQEITWGPSNGP